MSARDLAVVLAVLSALPFCLARPWIGVLTWTWLALMNPHQLTWGFAQFLPLSQLVGAATLVGFIFTGSRKRFVWSREMLLLTFLWVWFAATSAMALYPADAWDKFEQMSKILLMAFLMVPLFQDREKFRLLVFVIAGSIGFYGIKGGVFVLATGGQYQVLGPDRAFFGANTEMALALNMVLPFLVYLAREETRRWMRWGLYAAFVLTMISVPFTYSRGGVIGLVVVLVVLFLKARQRVLLIPVIAGGLVAFAMFAPAQWVSRMQTLEDVQSDGSGNLRRMSWQVAMGIAGDRPIFGGGFRVFLHRATYDIYMPEYPRTFGHDAHSIYFNMLGEHGWVGLGAFVALIVLSLLKLRSLRRLARANPQIAWASNYGHMLQASFATYLVNGAFLSVAYFDLAYQMLIMVPLLYAIAKQQLEAPPREPVEAEAAPVPAVVDATPVGRR